MFRCFQYGFARRKSTGAVNTKTVYSGGKHMLGPDYEFKIFRADAHFEFLTNVAVFTKDKLEVSIRAEQREVFGKEGRKCFI